MGNRRSVEKSLERVGARTQTTRDHAELRAADGILLPGVGAFPAAMVVIRELGLDEVLVGPSTSEVTSELPIISIADHDPGAVR